MFFFSPLFDIITIMNSGPYTRKFTLSLLRSKENGFKLSINHKTNGSLEKQSCRSAVVSMLWSPLPLSVTLLCGHSQAWFGYACWMRRAGEKNPVWWMWRSNMHGLTHTRMVSFQEDAFSSTAAVESHMTRTRTSKKRNMEQSDQCFYRFFSFPIECVLACHAWTGRGNLNYCAWLHGRQVPFNVFILLRA